tara:strand:+ start:309 stop:1001 length:693 start_codon:yes stop_codon:yes gene_type:complete
MNILTLSSPKYEEEKILDLIKDSKKVTDLKKADLVVFTGGNDISPHIYNSKNRKLCGTPHLSRDIYEIMMFKIAKQRGVPVLGICRGAQLLSCLSGHSLYQHVNNHCSNNHLVQTAFHGNYKVIPIPGDHHQMMKLDYHLQNKKGYKFELLGWAKKSSNSAKSNFVNSKIATEFFDENGQETKMPFYEPEIVNFIDNKALAIQGHPEWGLNNKLLTNFTNQLIEKTLFTT